MPGAVFRTIAAALAAHLCLHTPVSAGPYSQHSGDSANPHDAPIHADSLMISHWATSVIDYSRASNVSDTVFSINSDPNHALGPAADDRLVNDPQDPFDDTSLRTVSLGDLTQTQIDGGAQPGFITLGFASPIRDIHGPDFAVFENAFPGGFGVSANLVFGELGYVEVSTDGVNFARFDGRVDHTLGDLNTTFSTPGTHDFASFDPTGVFNLAGKHLADWGTPFDLSELAANSFVQGGQVDLSDIHFVRVVDIPGSGDFDDAISNTIYDSWVTIDSGGLDLDAVGVLPEPGTGVLLVGIAVMATARRARRQRIPHRSIALNQRHA